MNVAHYRRNIKVRHISGFEPGRLNHISAETFLSEDTYGNGAFFQSTCKDWVKVVAEKDDLQPFEFR